MKKLGLPALVVAILLSLGMILYDSLTVIARGKLFADPIVLTNDQDEYPLGTHMEIFEDPSGDLTVEDISSPAYQEKFAPSQVEVPVFGFTNSAYWVRINMRNESHSNNWFLDVLYPNLQYIDLYTPQAGTTGFLVRQTGSLRSPLARDLRYPRSIFILTVPSQGEQTIYLRFQSGSSMTLNLKLWSENTFFNLAIQEQIAFGIFFGVLIGLFFYNLFLLFSLKESNYFYFVILISAMILHEASYNGYLETYILPDLYIYKRFYHPVLFSLLIISLILFADSFMEFKKRSSILHQLTLVSATCCGILILLIPFVNYRTIAVLLLVWAFLSLLVVLTGGISNYARGVFRPAPLFMIAWFSMVALMLDVLLVRLGVTPSTFFSENTYRFGIMLVAILWSISLADRVNVLKTETDLANQEIRKNERRLSQILDGMPLGVFLYSKDLKPQYANRGTYQILSDNARGIQPDIKSGRTLSQAIEYFSLKIAGSHEPYPLQNIPIFHALQGRTAYADDLEFQREEKIIPLEMWASPILDDAGDVESAVVVFQDFSQRKRAEEILKDYREHLEQLVVARTTELNTTNKELHVRLEWLAAVNFVNQMIARSANFTEIHETIIEIINHLFATQDAFIAELNLENNSFVVLAHTRGKTVSELIGSPLNLPELSQLSSSLEPGKAIMVYKEAFRSLEGPLGRHVRDLEIQSIAFVPLQVRERILGFLGLEMHEEGRSITNEEANLLSIFSTDIAQLIEDAHLFEQAKLFVVSEERNRLARELHDSVAQAMYSISLFLNATRLALEANKPEVARSHLAELTQLSREAMADMRLLIFELRPPILEKSGLTTALQSRLESVEAKAGFQANFETEGNIHLSPAQESELYRIAQEALNNVTKHAQASRVNVRLTEEAGCVRLIIEDDGIGFDPITVEHGGGQGFRNMRERAANIGARCLFESVPGQGTKITIEVNE